MNYGTPVRGVHSDCWGAVGKAVQLTQVEECQDREVVSNLSSQEAASSDLQQADERE